MAPSTYIGSNSSAAKRMREHQEALLKGNHEAQEAKHIPEAPPSYSDLTIPELKELLDSREILYASSMKKGELIELLEEDDSSSEEDETE